MKRSPSLTMMYQKTKALTENPGNCSKLHLVDCNTVIALAAIGGNKNKKRPVLGLNPSKLLKTHVEKMSTFGLTMMSMKTNEIHDSYHYVADNTGS
jgi:hypothetical protein